MKEFILILWFSFQLNKKRECHSLLLLSEQNRAKQGYLMFGLLNLTRKQIFGQKNGVIINLIQQVDHQMVKILNIWRINWFGKSEKTIFPTINLNLTNIDSVYWIYALLFSESWVSFWSQDGPLKLAIFNSSDNSNDCSVSFVTFFLV